MRRVITGDRTRSAPQCGPTVALHYDGQIHPSRALQCLDHALARPVFRGRPSFPETEAKFVATLLAAVASVHM